MTVFMVNALSNSRGRNMGWILSTVQPGTGAGYVWRLGDPALRIGKIAYTADTARLHSRPGREV
ncbi:hypothetical protein OG225_13705 [Nocardia sp. NBC_01377]|uniref:hypothetical protein n=1 Tax=Nocardia sp. NBC_01377 TaxID=2903595 RepID=UPI0032513E73